MTTESSNLHEQQPKQHQSQPQKFVAAGQRRGQSRTNSALANSLKQQQQQRTGPAENASRRRCSSRRRQLEASASSTRHTCDITTTTSPPPPTDANKSDRCKQLADTNDTCQSNFNEAQIVDHLRLQAQDYANADADDAGDEDEAAFVAQFLAAGQLIDSRSILVNKRRLKRFWERRIEMDVKLKQKQLSGAREPQRTASQQQINQKGIARGRSQLASQDCKKWVEQANLCGLKSDVHQQQVDANNNNESDNNNNNNGYDDDDDDEGAQEVCKDKNVPTASGQTSSDELLVCEKLLAYKRAAGQTMIRPHDQHVPNNNNNDDDDDENIIAATDASQQLISIDPTICHHLSGEIESGRAEGREKCEQEPLANVQADDHLEDLEEQMVNEEFSSTNSSFGPMSISVPRNQLDDCEAISRNDLDHHGDEMAATPNEGRETDGRAQLVSMLGGDDPSQQQHHHHHSPLVGNSTDEDEQNNSTCSGSVLTVISTTTNTNTNQINNGKQPSEKTTNSSESPPPPPASSPPSQPQREISQDNERLISGPNDLSGSNKPTDGNSTTADKPAHQSDIQATRDDKQQRQQQQQQQSDQLGAEDAGREDQDADEDDSDSNIGVAFESLQFEDEIKSSRNEQVDEEILMGSPSGRKGAGGSSTALAARRQPPGAKLSFEQNNNNNNNNNRAGACSKFSFEQVKFACNFITNAISDAGRQVGGGGGNNQARSEGSGAKLNGCPAARLMGGNQVAPDSRADNGRDEHGDDDDADDDKAKKRDKSTVANATAQSGGGGHDSSDNLVAARARSSREQIDNDDDAGHRRPPTGAKRAASAGSSADYATGSGCGGDGRSRIDGDDVDVQAGDQDGQDDDDDDDDDYDLRLGARLARNDDNDDDHDEQEEDVEHLAPRADLSSIFEANVRREIERFESNSMLRKSFNLLAGGAGKLDGLMASKSGLTEWKIAEEIRSFNEREEELKQRMAATLPASASDDPTQQQVAAAHANQPVGGEPAKRPAGPGKPLQQLESVVRCGKLLQIPKYSPCSSARCSLSATSQANLAAAADYEPSRASLKLTATSIPSTGSASCNQSSGDASSSGSTTIISLHKFVSSGTTSCGKRHANHKAPNHHHHHHHLTKSMSNLSSLASSGASTMTTLSNGVATSRQQATAAAAAPTVVDYRACDSLKCREVPNVQAGLTRRTIETFSRLGLIGAGASPLSSSASVSQLEASSTPIRHQLPSSNLNQQQHQQQPLQPLQQQKHKQQQHYHAAAATNAKQPFTSAEQKIQEELRDIRAREAELESQRKRQQHQALKLRKQDAAAAAAKLAGKAASKSDGGVPQRHGAAAAALGRVADGAAAAAASDGQPGLVDGAEGAKRIGCNGSGGGASGGPQHSARQAPGRASSPIDYGTKLVCNDNSAAAAAAADQHNRRPAECSSGGDSIYPIRQTIESFRKLSSETAKTQACTASTESTPSNGIAPNNGNGATNNSSSGSSGCGVGVGKIYSTNRVICKR